MAIFLDGIGFLCRMGGEWPFSWMALGSYVEWEESGHFLGWHWVLV